ncbi:unnamed protein product [Ilex paraguariensis]|uniref:Transcription factor TFIIIB component B'' Myb domain-containing protein n=1 Tax=Ilex paraguariensis TaxID=185542 RepID=A0ABC8RBK0_9AQUA
MIQQLFPGRTRRQVKLKYKKEERQQRLRLHEALANRAKDHTHFKIVIERLQEIAAEEKHNSNLDDSVDLADEDPAETATPETNEEVTKYEQTEEGEIEIMETDVPEFNKLIKEIDGLLRL